MCSFSFCHLGPEAAAGPTPELAEDAAPAARRQIADEGRAETLTHPPPAAAARAERCIAPLLPPPAPRSRATLAHTLLAPLTLHTAVAWCWSLRETYGIRETMLHGNWHAHQKARGPHVPLVITTPGARSAPDTHGT